MAAIRGRGIGRGTVVESKNAQALRRPGTTGVMQTFISETDATTTVSNQVKEICEKLLKFDFNSEVDSSLVAKIKEICNSSEDMEQCVDAVFSFALKNKWNAHVTAILCNAIGDITVNEAKFRMQLLRKLQTSYKERNNKYSEKDSFLMDVTFLSEIYHHVRIEGACLKVLSRPLIDYFCMLVDGSSQKEIEIFVDQFPKCYRNLKLNVESEMDILTNKLRKALIRESSSDVRAMLLEMFENILTDFEPLKQNVKDLYGSLSKPIVRVCE